MKTKTNLIICCILVLTACLIMSCDSRLGSLTVVTGPMYSGKTAKLIDYIIAAQLAKKKVYVYSHSFDTKRTGELSSRAYPNVHIEAFKTCEANDIVQDFLQGDCDCIAIDEAQFFKPHLAYYVKLMIDCRAKVYVSGLDTNFRGEPFSDTMGKLCQMASRIDKLTARCAVCGKDATMTQRLVNGEPANIEDELVVVEGSCDVVKYEPRCRDCHIVKCYG